MSITGDLSENCWAYFTTAMGSSNAYQIASKWLSTGNQRSYDGIRFEDSATEASRQLVFSQSPDGSGGSSRDAIKAWPPSANTWYMLTVVYNATAGEVKFYVNGSQQGTTATSQTTSLFDGTASFGIGAQISASVGNFMDGYINQLLLYSKQLTTTEISDLYNTGTGIPYEAGGVAAKNLMLLGVGV